VVEYLSCFYQTIDEKGRVVLPGKLRRLAQEESGERGALTFKIRECDGGLSLYTKTAWAALRQHYTRYPETSREGRWAKRFFYMSVDEIKADKQGRITIPAAFRKRAGLEGEIIIFGVGDHIEIWSRERYEQLLRKRDEQEENKPPFGRWSSEGGKESDEQGESRT